MSHSRALAESTNYIVVHEFEDVVIVGKRSGTTIRLGSHYGDAQVAVIADDESWFAAGGDGVTLHHAVAGFHEFLRSGSVVAEEPVTLRYHDREAGEVTLDAMQRTFAKSVR
ncbi:MAG TPA: hypothetical protein VMU84_02320, partial [Thermoanaerobaculia bacterium]|nr:hypothetical protein [Thermoanaerobaculia bacterium]